MELSQTAWAKRIFFLFLVCFSLLPLSFSYLGPMLIVVYAVMGIFFLKILMVGWNWKPAVGGGAVFLYTVVYAVFGSYSLLVSPAELELIFKDSVGFIFYPAYFPLVALMVAGKIGRCEWECFLIVLGVAVSIFHVVAYFAFYQLYGVLTFETLTAVNEVLKNIGTASKYATGGGVLRVDSGLGLLLIIPMLIVLSRILQKPSSLKNLFLITIMLLGILLEGHRALAIVVAAGCFLYVIWLVLAKKNHTKLVIKIVQLSLLLGTGMLILAIMFGDELTLVLTRFSDLTNGNSAGALLDTDRSEQIHPLIAKIAEAPILGNGFGTNASLIRNTERPFMYEIDYLAVLMKLGLLGGFLYFSAYAYLMYLGVKKSRVGNHKIIYFFAGLAFFVYAGTNGGFAMSVFSTLFHLYLMIGLSVEYHSSLCFGSA
jgi:hypothetical protein